MRERAYSYISQVEIILPGEARLVTAIKTVRERGSVFEFTYLMLSGVSAEWQEINNSEEGLTRDLLAKIYMPENRREMGSRSGIV